jgi:DHA1 family multidrug resistance protein-like MFS transporter
MLTAFVLQAANTIATPMLPLCLKEVAADSKYIGSSTGSVLGVGAGAAAVSAALVCKYSSLFGYWKTLGFCLTAGAILTVPQIFVSNMIQLTLFRAMASFCIGGAIPVLNAILAVRTEKEYQGSVYGFNSAVSSAGGALGPMIGSIVAMINYRMVFLATAILLGLSAYGTIKRSKGLQEE